MSKIEELHHELTIYGKILDMQDDENGIRRVKVVKYKDEVYFIIYLGLGYLRYNIYKVSKNQNIAIFEKYPEKIEEKN